MKIVHINTVPNGSTGSIMLSIHKELQKLGHESYVVWGRGRKSNSDNEIYMNDKVGVYLHVLYSRLTGKTGFASKISTKKLLKKLDEINPDIIHLHNIHGYYINIELLFNYIKNKKIKVIWTLHDCWPFTGHCTHYAYENCLKWQDKCDNCPLKESYPKSLLDASKNNYIMKKKLFTSVDNMILITPSKWLKDQVDKSFLKKYNSIVINNGIDTKVFKKKESKRFRLKYNIDEKIILLGIASPWVEKKGLKDLLMLNSIMDKEKFKLVLVGLSEKQVKELPDDIIKIKRTSNVEELVDIYNESDYLINPTYEDNYPTINIESIACGTPVITYDTGGSPEIIMNNSNGIVVKKTSNHFCKENVMSLLDIINNAKINKNNMKHVCLLDIDKNNMINKYLNIYEKMVGDR